MFILNHSPELTFRDHKKANIVEETLHIPILRLSSHFKLEKKIGSIVYSTLDELSSYLGLLKVKMIKKGTLIIDEYDSIFFEGQSLWADSNRFTQMFDTIIAFSGSELQGHHK